MKTTPVGSLPILLPDEIAQNILAYEWELDAAHCVLGNMQYKIPSDDKLFVVVFDDMGPSFGQCDFLDTDPTSPTYLLEVQQSTILHAIRVEIMGYIKDDGYDVAKEHAALVANAFAGIFAQQLMGQYKLQFGRVQAPVNASAAEGANRLVRYHARTNTTVLHQRAKTPPGAGYDDKFNGATVDGKILPPALSVQE